MTQVEFDQLLRRFAPKQRSVLIGLSKGLSVTNACTTAKIPERTFYDWQQKNVQYREAVAEAKEQSISGLEQDMVECALQAKSNPRYVRALEFLLERRRPDIYGQRQTIITKNPEPIKLILEDEKPEINE